MNNRRNFTKLKSSVNDRQEMADIEAIHTAIHNSVAYSVLLMTYSAVRALLCRCCHGSGCGLESCCPPFSHFHTTVGHTPHEWFVHFRRHLDDCVKTVPKPL